MFENLQWFLIFQFIYSVDVLSCFSLYKEKVQLSLAYEFLKRNSLRFCLFSFLFQVKSTNVVSIFGKTVDKVLSSPLQRPFYHGK